MYVLEFIAQGREVFTSRLSLVKGTARVWLHLALEREILSRAVKQSGSLVLRSIASAILVR